uniref:Immunoglobulin heavy variable 6-1 n=1 Tax=Sphenodon punctatus TaxID=8508 RepID=A0A8D0G8R4_SPHPU
MYKYNPLDPSSLNWLRHSGHSCLQLFPPRHMMKSLLMFLSLLASPSCVLSIVQLQESGPGLAKPSQSLRLTCTITSDSVSSTSTTWEWIRQPPGKGLEWVGRIYYRSSWGTDYTSSLQGRTTITQDTSKNEYYLQMISLTAADTATYYCARGSQ